MKKKFKLENLDCANCAAKIEEKVKNIDGVDNASVSFMMQKLVIEADESVMDRVVSEAKSVIKAVEPDCTVVD